MIASLRTTENPVDGVQHATFYLGDTLMGIPIDQIEEINRHLQLTPVPHAAPHVRGVLNLRGEVVTVIDLRQVLGGEPTEITPRCRNVIVSSQGERFGLLVDRVADVVTAAAEHVGPPPANLQGAEGKFFRAVCKLEKDLLVLLDVEAVLAT